MKDDPARECEWALDRCAAAIQAVARGASPRRSPRLAVKDLDEAKERLAEAVRSLDTARAALLETVA